MARLRRSGEVGPRRWPDGRRHVSGASRAGARNPHFPREGRVVVRRGPMKYCNRRLRLRRRRPDMIDTRQLRAPEPAPRHAPRGAVAVARVAGQIAMLPLTALVTLLLALMVTVFTGLGWHTQRY